MLYAKKLTYSEQFKMKIVIFSSPDYRNQQNIRTSGLFPPTGSGYQFNESRMLKFLALNYSLNNIILLQKVIASAVGFLMANQGIPNLIGVGTIDFEIFPNQVHYPNNRPAIFIPLR